MAPSFLVVLLYFALVSFADVILKSKDLATRSGQSQVLSSQVGTEPELMDIVLVASVDGNFRALNRTSGQTLWSMSSYGSADRTSSASALAPLVRTVHPDRDPDLVDDSTDHELYIIEPQSGDIYVMTTPTSPLQRFPFSMSELVDMSPFSFADGDDYRVFVGRKETSLLLVELETGKVTALNSACPWDPFDLQVAEDDVDLDELEGAKDKRTQPTEVFIGRTDYHISILRPRSSKTSARVPVQNLSFSTYGPNNQDNLLQASYRRTRDNSYIQSLPNGDIISFKVPRDEREPLLWGTPLGSTVIAVFDIFRKPPTHPNNAPHTFVLLQPSPSLQDIGSLATDASHVLPSPDSAYVGMVEETGSLFAMSPSKYPLVAFGPSSRHTTPEGIEGRLDDTSELPLNVDDVTRARKEKERHDSGFRGCNSANPSDRRCLVGVRKLAGGDGEGDQSRLDRLLDGAPANESHQNPSSNVSDAHEERWSIISTQNRLNRWSSGNFWQAIVTATFLASVSLWFILGRSRVPYPGNESDVNVPNREPLSDVSFDTPTTPSSVDQTQTPPQTPPQTPSRPAPLLLKSNVGVDDDEETDREAEDDSEITPVSGRRKPRRGRRGNKKKKALPMPEGDEKDKRESANNINDDLPQHSSLTFEASKIVSTPSLVVSDTVLGYGSHGTVVYQGSLQGRAVAVKRLLRDFVTLASREVSILQESDDHPNVIRYYYQETHENFLYIALELCPASLADVIECPDRFRELAIGFDPKRALREITSGLRHLHALKLVHRDIKPQNILVSFPKASHNSRGTYRMLISDFGLCKKLDVDQTSFLPTAYGAMAAGTIGWRAPEILRGEVKLDEIGDDQSISSSRGSNVSSNSNSSSTPKPTRLTKSIDIFALGCLFYYTLTNGSHPYGDRYEREVNILKNAKCLDGLERFGEEGSEAVDLINQMLTTEANKRPDTTTCLLHPFFWDPGRRLNFIQDASDLFEKMNRDPKDPILVILEDDASSIVGHDWQTRVDKIFLDNLGKFRKYDGRSVQDLLRALRNKKNHYQDLPDNVKRHLGAMPDGYLAYFTRRYPRLFLHVYSVISNTTLRSESVFRSYFEIDE